MKFILAWLVFHPILICMTADSGEEKTTMLQMRRAKNVVEAEAQGAVHVVADAQAALFINASLNQNLFINLTGDETLPNWDDLKRLAEPVTSKLEPWVKGAASSFMKGPVVAAVGTAAAEGAAWAAGVGESAAAVCQDAGRWTEQAAKDAVQNVGSAGNDFGDWAEGAASDVVTWSDGAVNDASQWCEEAVENVIEFAEEVGEFLTKGLINAKEWVEKLLAQAGKELERKVRKTLGEVAVCTGLQNFPSVSLSDMTNALCFQKAKNLVTGIVEAISDITSTINSLASALVSMLGDMDMYKSIFGQLGKQLVDSVETLFTKSPEDFFASQDVGKSIKKVMEIITVYWRKHATPLAHEFLSIAQSIASSVEAVAKEFEELVRSFAGGVSLTQLSTNATEEEVAAHKTQQALQEALRGWNGQHWYISFCASGAMGMVDTGVCIYFPFKLGETWGNNNFATFGFGLGLQAEGGVEVSGGIMVGPIFTNDMTSLQGNANSLGVDIDMGTSGSAQFALDLSLTFPDPMGPLISFDVFGGVGTGLNKANAVGAGGGDISPFYGSEFALAPSYTSTTTTTTPHYESFPGWHRESMGYSRETAPCDLDSYIAELPPGAGYYFDPTPAGGWCKTIQADAIDAVRQAHAQGHWTGHNTGVTYLPYPPSLQQRDAVVSPVASAELSMTQVLQSESMKNFRGTASFLQRTSASGLAEVDIQHRYTLNNGPCLPGAHVVTAEECEYAYGRLKPMLTRPAQRGLVSGNFNGVPWGCSLHYSGSYVTSKNDASPHFNIYASSDSSRAISGEFRQICKRLYVMQVSRAATCPEGTEIVSPRECWDAWVELQGKFKYPPVRRLVQGSWNGVPRGCSIEYEGVHVDASRDQSPHWNTIGSSDNARATNGEFRNLCKRHQFFITDYAQRQCPAGAGIEEPRNCQNAYDALRGRFTEKSQRGLVQGHWDELPPECSIQYAASNVNNDQSPHFNTYLQSSCSRATSGEFFGLCKEPSYWMSTAQTCPPGTEIVDQHHCKAAYEHLRNSFRYPSKRGIVSGNWNGVPDGCSVEAYGGWVDQQEDISPHWNVYASSDNSRSGEFRPLCMPARYFMPQPGTATCPSGAGITTKAECLTASLKLKFKYPAKRGMADGHYGGVPHQCSMQYQHSYVESHKDQTPHWNTNSATDNHKSTSGEFVPICKVPGI